MAPIVIEVAFFNLFTFIFILVFSKLLTKSLVIPLNVWRFAISKFVWVQILPKWVIVVANFSSNLSPVEILYSSFASETKRLLLTYYNVEQSLSPISEIDYILSKGGICLEGRQFWIRNRGLSSDSRIILWQNYVNLFFLDCQDSKISTFSIICFFRTSNLSTISSSSFWNQVATFYTDSLNLIKKLILDSQRSSNYFQQLTWDYQYCLFNDQIQYFKGWTEWPL